MISCVVVAAVFCTPGAEGRLLGGHVVDGRCGLLYSGWLLCRHGWSVQYGDGVHRVSVRLPDVRGLLHVEMLQMKRHGRWQWPVPGPGITGKGRQALVIAAVRAALDQTANSFIALNFHVALTVLATSCHSLTMSSVAAMQSLSPGDEDLAQLYHQVLAGFAEESPSGEQSGHPSMSPSSDRDLESFYGQYHDGEGTPTANRMQPSARSATNCASFRCSAHPV